MASNFAYGKSVFLNNLRLQWGDIFTPGNPMEEGGAAKYKAVGLFTKDSPNVAVAKAAMLEVAREHWGANAETVMQNITANSKAVRDGNSKIDDAGNVKPEFKDMLFISCANKSKPRVVAPRKHNGQFVFITEEGRGVLADGTDVTDQVGYKIEAPYRGCYVNLKVQFIAGKAFTVQEGGKTKTIPNQVYARLEAIQFVKGGDPFGPANTSAEGFGDEDVDMEVVDASALF